jgi:hypothetical protein
VPTMSEMGVESGISSRRRIAVVLARHRQGVLHGFKILVDRGLDFGELVFFLAVIGAAGELVGAIERCLELLVSADDERFPGQGRSTSIGAARSNSVIAWLAPGRTSAQPVPRSA